MKQKLAAFMYGRYGFDELGQFLIIVYFIVALCTVFIPNFIARIVVNVISLLLLVFIFYRIFSKNTPKRTAENSVYKKRTRKIREFFLLQKNKWKYRKTHVYRTCPSCGAHIKLKKIKGEHDCACPKCGKTFHIKVK